MTINRRFKEKRFAHNVIRTLLVSAFLLSGTAAIRGVGGEIRRVPGEYLTIQSAVDAAGEGDTIDVAAGVYFEHVIVSKSNLRLRGGQDVVFDGTGLNGIGIHVLGASAAARLIGVEVSGFEVRNFERRSGTDLNERAALVGIALQRDITSTRVRPSQTLTREQNRVGRLRMSARIGRRKR
jgi:hypothetical protein